MASDFWIVLQWWGSLFLVGAVAWPLTKALFGRSMTGPRPVMWWDGGYLFSKAVGMATVTWIVYVLGTIRLMPFSVASIGVALGAVFLVGLWGNRGDPTSPRLRGASKGNWGKIIFEEVFFFVALLFWSWVKGHEPSIRGLEKFMDYGFMQSILNSRYFPPADMWYAGTPINYYYFGHMVVAVLTRLSGLDLAYTFNLMLATIFALTLTMSFSIGVQLFSCHSREGGNLKPGSPIRSGMTNILAGLLTAFLVTMAGNMQTIYAFTSGYTGENVKPFWELLWPVAELWKRLPEGMQTYWYANATRFIPFTIHEFPGYSFVVSDVHGHVLSIPFVLLAIALLIHLFTQSLEVRDSLTKRIGRPNTIFLQESLAFVPFIFYGFMVGVLLMTNALDGPIYFALLVLVVVVNWNNGRCPKILQLGIVGVVAGLTSLPFLVHFKSFVTGLAVNCPPAFLANTTFGPIIFEGVEKCQISPLWMWWLLWGFFVYCGMGLIISKIKNQKLKIKNTDQKSNIFKNLNIEVTQIEQLLLIFFVFSLALVIFPEFFYFKDIYPAHFRSNTMFKLGYEAFILFSIVAGYTIVAFTNKARMNISNRSRMVFFIFLLPQLFLVSIFPVFAVRSYFGGLKKYEGIYGLNWLAREYPTDYSAIEWLKNQNVKCQSASWRTNVKCDRFALVEADGDSYTDYARFSAFTGIPTIIGWPVHEWLWRGSYDVVAPRREEVRLVYESENLEATRKIIIKYGVRYIVVGSLEREKYKSLQEGKLGELGKEVFRSGGTVIYATY